MNLTLHAHIQLEDQRMLASITTLDSNHSMNRSIFSALFGVDIPAQVSQIYLALHDLELIESTILSRKPELALGNGSYGLIIVQGALGGSALHLSFQ
jgi:hypothetical protein